MLWFDLAVSVDFLCYYAVMLLLPEKCRCSCPVVFLRTIVSKWILLYSGLRFHHSRSWDHNSWDQILLCRIYIPKCHELWLCRTKLNLLIFIVLLSLHPARRKLCTADHLTDFRFFYYSVLCFVVNYFVSFGCCCCVWLTAEFLCICSSYWFARFSIVSKSVLNTQHVSLDVLFQAVNKYYIYCLL